MNTEDKEFDLKWITNEPKDYDKGYNRGPRDPSTFVMSFQEYKDWRKQFVEGDPQAKSATILSQLKAMGYIGLYKRVAKKA